jgi:hypothetical protein
MRTRVAMSSVTRYGFTTTATNNGTAKPDEVTVSDDLTGANVTCAGPLAPGATCVLTTDYTVTAADVTAGQITNLGTGDSDQRGPVDDPGGPAAVVASLTRSLLDCCGCGLERHASVGDTLRFTTRRRTQQEPLTNVTVSWPDRCNVTCAGPLAPGRHAF